MGTLLSFCKTSKSSITLSLLMAIMEGQGYKHLDCFPSHRLLQFYIGLGNSLQLQPPCPVVTFRWLWVCFHYNTSPASCLKEVILLAAKFCKGIEELLYSVASHQPQNTEKGGLLLSFSLLWYGEVMHSLLLVNTIPLYLGETGQVQDKLLGSKIYSSWSMCWYKYVCNFFLLLLNDKCSHL